VRVKALGLKNLVVNQLVVVVVRACRSSRSVIEINSLGVMKGPRRSARVRQNRELAACKTLGIQQAEQKKLAYIAAFL